MIISLLAFQQKVHFDMVVTMQILCHGESLFHVDAYEVCFSPSLSSMTPAGDPKQSLLYGTLRYCQTPTAKVNVSEETTIKSHGFELWE